MRRNTMKEKLQNGEVVSGVVLQDFSPFIVEIVALSGFDWLFIDCEHAPLTIENVNSLVVVSELRRIVPLVRTPANAPEVISRYLDTGAMGIIIPGINSKEAAERAVKATKYPPLGDRGLAGVRAADYGIGTSLAEYVKAANEETMVLGVLEDKQGVENVNSILDTPGFDGLIIGTNDLSRSFGFPGQTKHPKVLEVIDRVLEAGNKKKKPIGGAVRMDEDPQEYVQKGFKMLQITASALLQKSSKDFLKNARSTKA